jgi:predicted ATP-binding protein involved in virulence
MRLIKFRLQNYRGYEDVTASFEDFTTVVGVNDVGKTTLLEALDVFFGNTKIDKKDRNIFFPDNPIVMTAWFDELPKTVVLETVETNLSNEYLLNADGQLEIKQIFSGASLGMKMYLVANMPDDPDVAGIHGLKISQLRNQFKDILPDAVDKTRSTDIRKWVLNNSGLQHNLVEVEEDVSGIDKNLESAILNELPLYQLFKSDRENSDGDVEVQSPIKAIVKATLSDNPRVSEQLNQIFDEVQQKVADRVDNILSLMKDMNIDVTNSLSAHFDSPKWDSIFKSSIDTDNNIALNKRGSGIRRLILLNFFRSEAEARISTDGDKKGIIYAFEEPETALHPKYQDMLISSFLEMSEADETQVIITTHSPAVAKKTPSNGVRLVQKENGKVDILEGTSAVERVIDELGIISDVKLYPDQIRRVVFLEGPSDESFFTNMYAQMSEVSEEMQQTVLFLSGGGTAINDVVTAQMIDQIAPERKLAIVDGDEQGTGYVTTLSEQGVKVLQLKKHTLELYLPFKVVESALRNHPQVPFVYDATTWEKLTVGLEKVQKRALKDKGVYASVKYTELSDSDQQELTAIFSEIDRIKLND